MDFQGAGVSVINDGLDAFNKIVTIPGNGINPPSVVATSSATSGASQVPTLTWSHVSSGINRLLLVQVETEAGATISGITYNGVALTQSVANTNGTLRNEQWYLVAPPVGTYSIIVTVTPNSYVTCGAETFNTVDQGSPIGATQSSTGSSLSPSLAIVTTSDNSLVVDSLATGVLPIAYTVGAGQVVNWNITANPNIRQGASSVEPAGSSPDNVTMSWAITQSTPWALTAVEVNGIASAGFADEMVRVSATDTTSGFLNPKLHIRSSDGSVTVVPTITNPGANEILDIDLTTTGGGGSGNIQIDSTPDNGTYGLLAGVVDGTNTTFTVSLSEYTAGKMLVFLNGLAQNQGVADDWVEIDPTLGTFEFNTPPIVGSVIVVEYQTVATPIVTGGENFIPMLIGLTTSAYPTFSTDDLNIAFGMPGAMTSFTIKTLTAVRTFVIADFANMDIFESFGVYNGDLYVLGSDTTAPFQKYLSKMPDINTNLALATEVVIDITTNSILANDNDRSQMVIVNGVFYFSNNVSATILKKSTLTGTTLGVRTDVTLTGGTYTFANGYPFAIRTDGSIVLSEIIYNYELFNASGVSQGIRSNVFPSDTHAESGFCTYYEVSSGTNAIYLLQSQRENQVAIKQNII